MTSEDTQRGRHGRERQATSGLRKALIGLAVFILVLVLGAVGVALGIRQTINSEIQHISGAIPTPTAAATPDQSPHLTCFTWSGFLVSVECLCCSGLVGFRFGPH